MCYSLCSYGVQPNTNISWERASCSSTNLLVFLQCNPQPATSSLCTNNNNYAVSVSCCKNHVFDYNIILKINIVSVLLFFSEFVVQFEYSNSIYF